MLVLNIVHIVHVMHAVQIVAIFAPVSRLVKFWETDFENPIPTIDSKLEIDRQVHSNGTQ